MASTKQELVENLGKQKNPLELSLRLDDVLNEYIPAEKLKEVKRIIYGYNQGTIFLFNLRSHHYNQSENNIYIH